MKVISELHVPAALTPGERTNGTHWTGGWMVPRAGLYDVENRKIFKKKNI
jgi:hypothetical protein